VPDSVLRDYWVPATRAPDPSLPDPGGAALRQGLSLPDSLRVALRDPGQVAQFRQALCRSERTGDCADGVAVVYEHPRRR
jgi:hypothetical protein